MTIKIATLLSVYRGDSGHKLSVALDSILQQKLGEDVESRLYVAVDGPVSSEVDCALEMRRPNIYRILRLPSNQGLAAALNALIATLEDEEFVFRMDADDRSEIHRYQIQLDHFYRFPDTDILGTDIIEVDEAGGCVRRVSYALDHGQALTALCRGVPVAHPTVCFRRKVLDVVGGYPMSGTNEDIALWFRCAELGFRFGNVPRALLYFTVSSSFWHRRGFKKSISELRCYVLGIWRLEGVTWKYIFPILRFMLRCAPSPIVRWFYMSSLRSGCKTSE